MRKTFEQSARTHCQICGQPSDAHRPGCAWGPDARRDDPMRTPILDGSPQRADDRLRALGDLFTERSRAYGPSYQEFGAVGKALFPRGIRLETEEDWKRWGVLSLMLTKLHRYVLNWENGGHGDSLDDLAVYAMMLREVDAQ